VIKNLACMSVCNGIWLNHGKSAVGCHSCSRRNKQKVCLSRFIKAELLNCGINKCVAEEV
jgi:hypothetical protein